MRFLRLNKNNPVKNSPSVCCGEVLSGGIALASQGEADGEDRSAFFFLLYAAMLQKCLQELGEPEQHEIRLGQSQ